MVYVQVYIAIAATSIAWLYILTRQERRPGGPVYRIAEPREAMAEGYRWN
jgi:hypothetical protein